MAQYVTVPQIVEAWRIPYWGRPADEPAPLWLTKALNQGEIFINHLGGLSRVSLFGDEECYCGDYAVLRDDGSISFAPGPDFASRHEKIRSHS